MFKISRFTKAAAMAVMVLPLAASATVADSWQFPASDPAGLRGASVPYTRYDCNYDGDATLGGGAALERDKTWNRFQITSQASDQTYVKMPVGASVTWNMKTYGDGVTVRYTIKDKHPGGHGQKGGYALDEGTLEFYVNDEYAGNPTIGGTSDADNIEFCHMYMNSNLCWRNEPQAVYKAFMDVWCGGSVIHDVWEEHFECGVWLGDYNSNPLRYSDGARIVNCRLRNNLADGVNFCQGTSNAAVYKSRFDNKC